MELQGDASRDHFWLSYLIFDPKRAAVLPGHAHRVL